MSLIDDSGPPPVFWKDALKDVVSQYNLMQQYKTGHSPVKLWHNRNSTPTEIYILGQYCRVPIHKPEGKLEPRGTIARLIHPVEEFVIAV